MASAKIYSLKGKGGEKVKLPSQFDTPYRPDIIKRAGRPDMASQECLE
jgi:ribosomal protein L4